MNAIWIAVSIASYRLKRSRQPAGASCLPYSLNTLPVDGIVSFPEFVVFLVGHGFEPFV